MDELKKWQAANPRPGKAGEWQIWRHADGSYEWRKKPRGTDTATGMSLAELIGLDPDATIETAIEVFTTGMSRAVVAKASQEGKETRLRARLEQSHVMQDIAQLAADENRKVDDDTLAALWHESGETGNKQHGRLKWVSNALSQRGVSMTTKRISDRLALAGIRKKQ